ncbi:MAG: hypothetical protein L6R36_003070 [Xanthoria steineri]|nr:MAG: hypothetical protein L6R36_003070 [Xanthoria steineri]
MVSTRSQGQEPIPESKISSTTKRDYDKRKRVDDAGSMTTPDIQAKKPKVQSASHGSKKNLSRTLAAVVIPTTNHHTSNVPSISPQHDASGYEANKNTTHSRENERETISQASGSQKESAGIEHSALSTETASSTPKKAKGLHTGGLPVETTAAGSVPALDTSTQPDNKPPNMRHKRFESEEATFNPFSSYPASPSRPVIDAQPTIQGAVSISSDDEAPDVVTKLSGQREARSVAAEATKTAEKQRAADKQRRRDRDSRLKSQAKISKIAAEKVRSKDALFDTSSEDGEGDDESSPHPSQGTWRIKDAALPALLPEDILAAEPTARMPTPPPKGEVVKATVNKRHRFLDQITQRPKDIGKVNIRIRVLEDRRAMLPPRISQDSQKLRESWLAGRLGPKGKVVVQRRKMRAGFVRR